MDDTERKELLERFEEIVSEIGDAATRAATCLAEAFPAWKVWLGDQGTWFASRAFSAKEMAEIEARLPSYMCAGSGETKEARTPGGLRELLAADLKARAAA